MVYVDGTIPGDVLRSRVFDALTTFDTLVTDQIGVIGMEVDEGDVQIVDDGGGGGGPEIEDETSELRSRSSNTGVIVGCVAGGLVALFVTVGLCRNRRQRRRLTHLKLDNEGVADVRTITVPEQASSGSEVNEQYETRLIHLDERSDGGIMSDWTPYSDEYAAAAGFREDRIELFTDEDIYWVNHPRDRGVVHECSAATCRICEARRQQGVDEDVLISILSDSSPPRPTPVPTNSDSRWYTESDTVQL